MNESEWQGWLVLAIFFLIIGLPLTVWGGKSRREKTPFRDITTGYLFAWMSPFIALAGSLFLSMAVFAFVQK